MSPLLKAHKWFYSPCQKRAFFKAKLNAALDEDCLTPQAAIEKARHPRTRKYVKTGSDDRIKPLINETKKKLNKEDECDLPKATGEELKMVSLAKRIDRDLACGHTVQLGFPLYFLRTWKCEGLAIQAAVDNPSDSDDPIDEPSKLRKMHPPTHQGPSARNQQVLSPLPQNKSLSSN